MEWACLKNVKQLHKETEDRWDEMVGSANGAPVGEATSPQCEMQRCSWERLILILAIIGFQKTHILTETR